MRAALRTRDGEMLWSLRLLLRRGVARSPPRLFVAVERPVSGTASSVMSRPATANMAANIMRRMFDDGRRWAAKTGSMLGALVGCHGLMIEEGGQLAVAGCNKNVRGKSGTRFRFRRFRIKPKPRKWPRYPLLCEPYPMASTETRACSGAA